MTGFDELAEEGLATGADAGLVLILPDDRAEAGQAIAGVTAVSRILIQAGEAGLGRAWVALDACDDLPSQVADELKRARCRIQVAWIDPASAAERLAAQTGPFTVLTCRDLVMAQALIRLSSQPAPTVLDGGSGPVAAQVDGATAARIVLDRRALAVARAQRISLLGPEHVPLDNPGRATRRIVRTTVKPSDGVVSRLVNRPISQQISSVLFAVPGVRPGHVTAATAALGVLMFAVLVFGGAPGLALGGALFQAASILDGVDGEIARAAYRTSPKGGTADAAVDMITNLLFVLGLTIGLYRVEGPIYGVIGAVDVGGFALGIGILAVYARHHDGEFDMIKEHYDRVVRGGGARRVYEALKAMMSRDFFALVFALLCVLGLGRMIPWMFGLAAGLWLILVLCALPGMTAGLRTVAARSRASARSTATDG